MKKLILKSVNLSLLLLSLLFSLQSCGRNKDNQMHSYDSAHEKDERPVGPSLGSRGAGQVIDKSSDLTLQQMIKTEVPKFKQLVYNDDYTGKSLEYNLFSPDIHAASMKVPLLLFMADASTPGNSVTLPLTQGYGALIWATDEWQKRHPCYVLVPQFSGVAVNDAYEHTDEVDIVIRLVKKLIRELNIDTQRVYTTGQSMGGMISMHYNVTYPDLFAASIFVDSQWNPDLFYKLVRHKFILITAGNGKAFKKVRQLEQIAKEEGERYLFKSWSAKLSQNEQDSIAEKMLAQGAPINIVNFTPGSDLPEDGKGNEHMYSFDYAYKLTPVREWLFRQRR